MALLRSPSDLTDEEIEECIDGSSNVDMIREIMTMEDVYDEEDSTPVSYTHLTLPTNREV